MEDYAWPGNVRQLVHSMDFAVNMAQGGCILPEHLPAPLHAQRSRWPLAAATAPWPPCPAWRSSTWAATEAHAIKAALAHYKGNMLQAAKTRA